MRVRAVMSAAAVGVVVLATGCAKSSSTAGATSTTRPGRPTTTTIAETVTTTSPPTTSTATPTTVAPSTTPATAASGPCRTGRPTIPTGASIKRIVDVDGDGKADTGAIWNDPVQGGSYFAIVTAAGGGDRIPIISASPIARRALVVNADQKGPVEILIDDGRSVQLYAFVSCRIQPVLNPQGQTYTFDLENLYGTGTGIGCNQTAAGRRLVGLEHTDNGSGPTVPWSRTVVELNGLTAHNGAVTRGTFTRGRDDAAIATLDEVSCGNLTIGRDGIVGPS